MLSMFKEAELVAVHDNPAVKAANATLLKALATKEAAETQEKRFIRIVTGAEPSYTDTELEQAHASLSIRKGSQAGWYAEAAEQARAAVKTAEAAYQAALIPAKDRLTKAGEAKLAELTKQLNHALEPARTLALEIEEVRQQMADGGAKPMAHPCPALLPDGTVGFQLRNARTLGWI